MHDTQVLKLQVTRLIDHLPAEGIRLLTDFMAFLESRFVALYKGYTTQTQEKPEEQWSESTLKLRQELFAAMRDQPFPGDEPFLGDVTLNEYLDLSDKEQARLWDEETTLDIMDLEEREIPDHALPAR